MEEPLVLITRMDDPLNSLPPVPADNLQDGEAAIVAAAQAIRERARRAVVRRLAALLTAAVVAFALTTWLLVRSDFSEAADENSVAAGVVRAQLDALGRAELREAYDLFSDHYRQQVSFEAFHELVAAHWSMFRAREVKFEGREASRVRAVLDTHILSSNGERYVARYTVVEVEGKWLIDDVHWGPDAAPHDRLTAQLRLIAFSSARNALD